ncbi:four helix bundle protein [Geobacter benzoatilyticus]|uniref:Four helix bundle protein n=1 Tax=Geobacter benzoatilyticus TaxID=2815309 RepID=A0ABX7Q0E5_9BACT|nr:four helix bundle protein [Geobacter benzoatilyticus]QSV44864.1 four helix bundle protein [Geobacter benzoatilyticus]
MEKPHRKLLVWEKSVELASMVYRITDNFPRHEQFGISSQMRRSAVSVPSNIAEGAARKGGKEFANFINISRGSLSELDTQIEIASRTGLLPDSQRQEIEPLMEEVDRLLYGLYRAVGRGREGVAR